jgi:hypothetical protein
MAVISTSFRMSSVSVWQVETLPTLGGGGIQQQRNFFCSCLFYKSFEVVEKAPNISFVGSKNLACVTVIYKKRDSLQ